MGRYLKNRQLATASYSVRLPLGNDILAPDSPVTGLVRYNRLSDKIEVYSENRWKQLVSQMGDAVEISKDTFVGDGYNRIFGPLRYSYNTGEELLVLVFVGNVFQNPGVAYTLLGDLIEFTSTPPDGETVVVLHGYAR
jgi:hypothetical protein